MKITVKQLKSLVEDVVLTEASTPAAAVMVKALEPALTALAEAVVDEFENDEPQLASVREDAVDAVFGRLSTVLESAMGGMKEAALAALGSEDERLPDDYEPCGECGFDHSYEYAEARAAHEELGKNIPAE